MSHGLINALNFDLIFSSNQIGDVSFAALAQKFETFTKLQTLDLRCYHISCLELLLGKDNLPYMMNIMLLNAVSTTLGQCVVVL
jgi:hypothetical protein